MMLVPLRCPRQTSPDDSVSCRRDASALHGSMLVDQSHARHDLDVGAGEERAIVVAGRLDGFGHAAAIGAGARPAPGRWQSAGPAGCLTAVPHRPTVSHRGFPAELSPPRPATPPPHGRRPRAAMRSRTPCALRGGLAARLSSIRFRGSSRFGVISPAAPRSLCHRRRGAESPAHRGWPRRRRSAATARSPPPLLRAIRRAVPVCALRRGGLQGHGRRSRCRGETLPVENRLRRRPANPLAPRPPSRPPTRTPAPLGLRGRAASAGPNLVGRTIGSRPSGAHALCLPRDLDATVLSSRASALAPGGNWIHGSIVTTFAPSRCRLTC